MDEKRILIIDDEREFSELFKMHLEAISNFKIDIALNGKDGIAMAKSINPDLILLDVLMPQMGGHEVLKNLKEDPKTVAIPVIMLSALDTPESKSKAVQLYDEEYIIKPIEAKDLKNKIEEVLRRRGL